MYSSRLFRFVLQSKGKVPVSEQGLCQDNLEWSSLVSKKRDTYAKRIVSCIGCCWGVSWQNPSWTLTGTSEVRTLLPERTLCEHSNRHHPGKNPGYSSQGPQLMLVGNQNFAKFGRSARGLNIPTWMDTKVCVPLSRYEINLAWQLRASKYPSSFRSFLLSCVEGWRRVHLPLPVLQHHDIHSNSEHEPDSERNCRKGSRL